MAESKVLKFSQDPLSGFYKIDYSFNKVGNYSVNIYLNGFLMEEDRFNFTVISDYLSTLHTKTSIYGYLQYAELDCIFARRYFYIVFQMRDKFENIIPHHDIHAFADIIKADLSLGVIYETFKCHQYSRDIIDKVMCHFEPTTVGDDQILNVYDANDPELSFEGFPISISVKPFR
jgi:hypothetical protein